MIAKYFSSLCNQSVPVVTFFLHRRRWAAPFVLVLVQKSGFLQPQSKLVRFRSARVQVTQRVSSEKHVNMWKGRTSVEKGDILANKTDSASASKDVKLSKRNIKEAVKKGIYT